LAERVYRTLRRIVAAQVTAELIIHLDSPVSTNSVQCELHKFNVHGGAAIAKLLITARNAQMCK
jgi:hypothetical protein